MRAFRLAVPIGLMAASYISASLVGAPAARASEVSACSLPAGRLAREIVVGGETRRYWLNAGPDVPGAGPVPLVFIWHGWGGSPQGMLRAFPPPQLWPGAIFVAAEGLPRRFPGLGVRRRPGWQVESGEFEDRDLALFDAIRKALQAEGCVDETRVYSTGFSNGGYFSNLLGCQRADTLAAIAPVSGGGPHAEKCGEATPVLIMHGTSDRVVPYREGEESFRKWSANNDCEDRPAAATTSCVYAVGCSAEVRFCSNSDGHRFSRGAAQRIVDFLRTHRRD